ncbi:MAG TPA: hypothetical protein VM184_06365 [Gaiellaceae bacterium]|nr:hypothetical protein [Gaiellaceae bacterium]
MPENQPARRALVVVNDSAPTSPLLDLLRARGTRQVLVVAPSSDQEAAERRLLVVLNRLEAGDFDEVGGIVGDPDPTRAIEEGLDLFAADEVVIVDRGWSEAATSRLAAAA